jgi:predicted transcriptional regulator of viral defense system
MTELSLTEKVLISILKNDLVVSAKDAAQILGKRSDVYRLEEDGVITKVEPSGLGFFSLPDTDEDDAHYTILAKYYKKCVVSGKTALLLYGLGEDYINTIDVDIPNTTNLETSIFNIHRVAPKMFTSIIKKRFEENGVSREINIYTPERTLHEAYKYYGKGTDAFIRAIKRFRTLYLDQNRPGEQYDQILKINKKIGMVIVELLRMGDVSE